MPLRLRVPRPRLVAAGLVALAAIGAAVYWFVFRPDPGDPRLNAFVRARPPVPVVFTSRSEPLSFEAAAPEGEEFRYPGQRLWAAREGRLRLLTPHGTVRELTWGKPLPDGGTLIDVMSPSVSLDGKTVLFAGRKGEDDHGHFRLYEVGIDGSGLRPLTGGPDDYGTDALPPMRFAADGSVLPDDVRRKTDYDDVDPVEIRAEPRQILFASSRAPDLGRDHARRSTTIWLRHADGHRTPVTANRNNDRWPWMMASGYVAFSLWSRNREVISADRTDIRPFDPAVPSATQPTDAWLGAFLRISSSGHFGMLVKPATPVWRPRALSNGQIAFMTPSGAGLTVAQAEPGLIANVPSAAAGPLPRQSGARLRRGPDRDADGRALWLATPSPCPSGRVLLSGAPLDPGRSGPAPGAFGLYLASDNWPEQDAPASAAGIGLQLLFDDPELVDAEPVAVYVRKVYDVPLSQREPRPDVTLTLANGRTYRGPAGSVFATGLDKAMMNDLPGQTTDAGAGPIFVPPPENSIARLKVYAARRDRFDDPVRPRVPGAWELLLELPAKDAAGGQLPTDAPTVLAGFGADGKVVRWETDAADSEGRRAAFYAFAGDHYSLTAPSGKHFCVSCHPGHSGMPRSNHRHAEAAGYRRERIRPIPDNRVSFRSEGETMRRVISAAAAFLMAALAGCGSSAKPCSISGTVSHGGEKMTWSDGGTLLVIFMPEDASKSDRYSARETDLATATYKIQNIPPGRYKVAVQQFYPNAKTNFNDALGGRYDPGHTDLVVEVTHDGQVLDIDVPKAAANPPRKGGQDKEREKE